MNRLSYRSAALAAAICLLLVRCPSASAQRAGRGGARLFGAIPSVTLATLEEVQKDLKLSDDQKEKVKKLNDELMEERGKIFQNANGDFDKMRQDMMKLYGEMKDKADAELQDPQKKRLQQIYLQVNGAVALNDETVAKDLKLTDEQKGKLKSAADEARQKMFDSFQDFQSMSDDEKAKKGEELVKDRDDSLMAVLTDEQRQEFEKLKGDTLEVDLSKLPRPGGR